MGLFSGTNFRLIPTTNQLYFQFQNLYLDNTGVASIGFSGNSGSFNYTFKNGTVYSPIGKRVYKYNILSPFSISGIINGGTYSYYINQNLIENNSIIPNNIYQNISINTTGTNLNGSISLSTNPITIQVNSNPTFLSFSGLNGTINNYSNSTIKIYNSNLYFVYSDNPLLSGTISGNISGNSSLNFFLTDIDSNPQYYDMPVQFVLNLYTNIGTITNTFNVTKSSGQNNTINIISASSQNVQIPVLFNGSGLPNQFVYQSLVNPSALITYSTVGRDYSGNRIPQTINFSVNPIFPLNSGSYQSQYVTGITITNSGEYLSCPQVQFTGYYAVTGLNWNMQSVLLNSGCIGNIPVYFTSIDKYGTGASGYITTQPILLSGIYSNGLRYFTIPTNFILINGGTGYTQPPLAHLNTGIYSNCYDVPLLSGNNSIFAPFNAYGSTVPLASYFTGVTVCQTGLVNNNTQTGYLVSGITIYNVGSGYNNVYFPLFNFIRSGGDGLIKNATGIALMKQSGLYLFKNTWGFSTGVSSYQTINVTGNPYPSGQFILDDYQNSFYIQVNYSGIDATQPIVVSLTVSNTGGYSYTTLISGTQSYNTNPFFLKKNSLTGLVYFQAGNQLSFLVSQNDLDSIYSSKAYSSNQQIFLGDLDF